MYYFSRGLQGFMEKTARQSSAIFERIQISDKLEPDSYPELKSLRNVYTHVKKTGKRSLPAPDPAWGPTLKARGIHRKSLDNYSLQLILDLIYRKLLESSNNSYGRYGLCWTPHKESNSGLKNFEELMALLQSGSGEDSSSFVSFGLWYLMIDSEMSYPRINLKLNLDRASSTLTLVSAIDERIGYTVDCSELEAQIRNVLKGYGELKELARSFDEHGSLMTKSVSEEQFLRIYRAAARICGGSPEDNFYPLGSTPYYGARETSMAMTEGFYLTVEHCHCGAIRNLGYELSSSLLASTSESKLAELRDAIELSEESFCGCPAKLEVPGVELRSMGSIFGNKGGRSKISGLLQRLKGRSSGAAEGSALLAGVEPS